MLLKTFTSENYFGAAFIGIAKTLISDEGSPFNQDDQAKFLAHSLGQSVNKILYEFNYGYFAFNHSKRRGMNDEFDKYSMKILDKFINELKELIPTGDRKQIMLYSLTCNKLLTRIIEDLSLLGDTEFIEYVKLKEVEVLSWITKD